MQVTFESIEDFYNQDPRRRTSPEADYGSHWHTDGSRRRCRVSYIQDTGEVYSVELSGRDGPVELLGKVPADEQSAYREVYYRTLDAVLDGWAEHSASLQGPGWVKQRIAAAGYTTYG